MKQIKALLAQPYPYYFKGKNVLYISLIIFGMSMIFNYLFEPFVVYRPEHRLNYFWISFAHSFNAFLIAILIIGTTDRVVNEDSWKVRDEIALIGFLLLMIGIGQFLIRDFIYDNPDNWTWRYFFEEVRNTFLAGILFVFILVPLNFMRLNRAHLKTSQVLNSKQKSALSWHNSLTRIITQQKSDDFDLNLNHLLFIKAEGNYLELYLVEERKEIKTMVKRMTLKELENQLHSYPQFCKTHRSYMVNMHKVKQVKGNAQGYQLLLEDYPDHVPVSRGMIADFQRKYKNP